MWSPTLSSGELYHSGRLFQKWGVRNGPPYPLSRDQLSAAEKKDGWVSKFVEGRKVAKKKKQQQKNLEKARKKRIANKKEAEEKKRIIEKGSRDEVLKNQHRLSTEEMNKALDRLKQEDIVNQKIKDLSPKTYTRMEQFNHYADQARSLAVGTQKFIDAYNTGAGIYNAVMMLKGNEKRLPKINYSSQNGPSDNKPSNQNNQNSNNNNNGGNKSPKILQQAMTKAVVAEKKNHNYDSHNKYQNKDGSLTSEGKRIIDEIDKNPYFDRPKDFNINSDALDEYRKRQKK